MVNTEAQVEAAVRCSIILSAGSDSSMLSAYLQKLSERGLPGDYELVVVNGRGLEIDEKRLAVSLPPLKVLSPGGFLSQEQLFNKASMVTRGKFLLFVSSFIEFDKHVLEESINDLAASGEKMSVSANKNFILVERFHYASQGGFEHLLQDKKIGADKGNYGRDGGCVQISSTISAAIQARRVKPWSAINGDKTLRLDYDLAQESIVFDLGAYEGQWASDIFAKYCCTIHCFEPVKAFAENIETRFAKNGKIFAHRFGLSNADKKVKISHDATASSIFRGEGKEEIYLVKAIDFLSRHNINRIDLMKVNIEGGEYDLADRKSVV